MHRNGSSQFDARPHHKAAFVKPMQCLTIAKLYVLSVMPVCGGKCGRTSCFYPEIGTITEVVRFPGHFWRDVEVRLRWRLRVGSDWESGSDTRISRQSGVTFKSVIPSKGKFLSDLMGDHP
jgi:hypothetical protein